MRSTTADPEVSDAIPFKFVLLALNKICQRVMLLQCVLKPRNLIMP